jgi:hypothetical protein
MRDVIDIHRSQLGMGRAVTAFVNDDRGRRTSSERSRRSFCSTDMRVMGYLASWFTGIRAIDRTPGVVDV